MNSHCFKSLVALSVVVLPYRCADAAEICVRATGTVTGNLVLLGDVAEIFSADSDEAARLAALELVPGPPSGGRRYLRVNEIRDALYARGVNLAKHRFSGASQVEIGEAVPVRATATARRLSSRDATRANRMTREAISKYLAATASPRQAYQVELRATDEQLQALAESQSVVRATGGAAPWIGSQTFNVAFASPRGERQLSVSALVTVPVGVVTAARSLPRGSLLRVEDLFVQDKPTLGHQRDDQATFHDPALVVGMETTRNIAAGQIVTDQAVRQPLLVRRNDVVTIYCRADGVTVRTTGRARDEGSLGELIAVESFDRQKIFARVTGIQEVDVYGPPTRLETAAANVSTGERATAIAQRNRRRP